MGSRIIKGILIEIIRAILGIKFSERRRIWEKLVQMI
jgi:hypothetical protein